MRLMEVVVPGSEGSGMVAGIAEDQYRQLNEFPLSEQTRSISSVQRPTTIIERHEGYVV